jgi:hypothetical protein
MTGRPFIVALLVLLALLLVGCPPYARTGGGDDDDDSGDDDDSATDDDDAADDDDASDDDDAVDDDDAAGPEVVHAYGTYSWVIDLNADMEGLGYLDCNQYWDVAATAGDPAENCPGCTVVMRVDFLYKGTDCSTDLFGDEADFPNVEIGLAGGYAYQYNPGSGTWASFLEGGGTSSSWEGYSESIDYGTYAESQHLDVSW